MGHPLVGLKTINGEGIGEVNISYATDNTDHNLAADGVVMVSKVKADNGTVSLQIQQVSDLHQWLLGYFNTVYQSTSDQWALGYLNISSANGYGNTLHITGLSNTKRSDQPFQQQGQMVTWNFMATAIDSQGSLISAIVNIPLQTLAGTVNPDAGSFQ